MIDDRKWKDVVKLADSYKAIGQNSVHLFSEQSYPWEFVTKVEAGCLHRYSTPVSASFIAKHPCGITFTWSIDYETRDANGAGTFRFNIENLLFVHSQLKPQMQEKFEALLGAAAKDIRAQADELATSVKKLYGDAAILENATKAVAR
jgi:hypothetical protein